LKIEQDATNAAENRFEGRHEDADLEQFMVSPMTWTTFTFYI